MTKEKALEVLSEIKGEMWYKGESQKIEALQIAIGMIEQDLNFECLRAIMTCAKWCGDPDCKVKQVGDAI